MNERRFNWTRWLIHWYVLEVENKRTRETEKRRYKETVKRPLKHRTVPHSRMTIQTTRSVNSTANIFNSRCLSLNWIRLSVNIITIQFYSHSQTLSGSLTRILSFVRSFVHTLSLCQSGAFTTVNTWHSQQLLGEHLQPEQCDSFA